MLPEFTDVTTKNVPKIPDVVLQPTGNSEIRIKIEGGMLRLGLESPM